jgi:hypothetical protein
VPLATYDHFADRDQLAGVVLERMIAGVSTRRCRSGQEPVGEVESDEGVFRNRVGVSYGWRREEAWGCWRS